MVWFEHPLSSSYGNFIVIVIALKGKTFKRRSGHEGSSLRNGLMPLSRKWICGVKDEFSQIFYVCLPHEVQLHMLTHLNCEPNNLLLFINYPACDIVIAAENELRHKVDRCLLFKMSYFIPLFKLSKICHNSAGEEAKLSQLTYILWDREEKEWEWEEGRSKYKEEKSYAAKKQKQKTLSIYDYFKVKGIVEEKSTHKLVCHKEVYGHDPHRAPDITECV